MPTQIIIEAWKELSITEANLLLKNQNTAKAIHTMIRALDFIAAPTKSLPKNGRQKEVVTVILINIASAMTD